MDTLTLRPWSDGDIDLLRAANTAAMTAHLNGPETSRQVDDRHARYLRLTRSGEARMFVIEDAAVGDAAAERVGSIGCWQTEWRGGRAWETGWFVLPAMQGRGIASAALGLLIDDLRARPETQRQLLAFPEVDNGPSNGVCRRNGFQLVGRRVETFRDAELEMNEWVLDLAVEVDAGPEMPTPPTTRP